MFNRSFFSIIVVCTFFSLNSDLYARKDLGAHVHGVVSMDIATDKNQILIMLNSPAESFFGFEYKASSKKEKMILKKVKNEWANVIQFLGQNLEDCKVSSSSWNQKFTGKSHSSITAEAYIDCKKLAAGRKLTINLKENYERIKTIRVQLLREDGSTINKKFESKKINIKI